jgi:hypothetical protein
MKRHIFDVDEKNATEMWPDQYHAIDQCSLNDMHGNISIVLRPEAI